MIVAVAWIFGILALMCTIVGIITAVEILPVFLPALAGMFWLARSF